MACNMLYRVNETRSLLVSLDRKAPAHVAGVPLDLLELAEGVFLKAEPCPGSGSLCSCDIGEHQWFGSQHGCVWFCGSR